MIFMRNLICIILVLVLCMSLALPTFAAAPSAGDDNVAFNPKTGDTIMLWAVIMLVALVALAAVVIFYRKFAR